MISRISKGYWVWGQFDPGSTKQIASLYKKINKKLNGPNFDVHLTISGPIAYEEELHTPIFKNLSSSLPKFKIQLDGLGYKDEFFQSLFLNVVENQDLKKLKMLVDRNFNLNEAGYFPHISLFYGKADEGTKINIVNKSTPPKQVLLDKISVVKVDEEIKSWKVLKSYQLLENTP